MRSLYPENEIIDEDEEDWIEHLGVARSRGKGTPKKKRTAAGRVEFIPGEATCMLTICRIEEVQQAQVNARQQRCTINEALDGVTLGLAQICTISNGISRSLQVFSYGIMAISCS